MQKQAQRQIVASDSANPPNGGDDSKADRDDRRSESTPTIAWRELSDSAGSSGRRRRRFPRNWTYCRSRWSHRNQSPMLLRLAWSTAGLSTEYDPVAAGWEGFPA